MVKEQFHSSNNHNLASNKAAALFSTFEIHISCFMRHKFSVIIK